MTELEKILVQTNEQRRIQLENQVQQIERLAEQIEYLTRKLFGTSSEKKVDENQLSLLDEDESFFDQAETTEEKTTDTFIEKRPKVIGRKAALT